MLARRVSPSSVAAMSKNGVIVFPETGSNAVRTMLSLCS